MDSNFVSDFAHRIWCRDRTQEWSFLVDGVLSWKRLSNSYRFRNLSEHWVLLKGVDDVHPELLHFSIVLVFAVLPHVGVFFPCTQIVHVFFTSDVRASC